MFRRAPLAWLITLSLLLSAVLHIVLWSALPAHAANREARAVPSTSRVEFETLEPPPPPPAPPPQAAPEPPAAVREPPPRRPTVQKPRTPAPAPSQVAPEPSVTPAPAQGIVLPPSAAEPAPEPKRDAPLAPGFVPSLSPRSAAMSVWQMQPPADTAPTRERTVAEIEQAATRELNARLRPAPPPREEPLVIKCDASKRCTYTGKALDATILPDGRFEIEERPQMPLPQLGMAMPTGQPTKGENIQAEREMNLATQFKQPSVAAERARFLKETEALRSERMAAWNKQVEADGARAFRARLKELWTAATPSTEQKRRALFELWQETSPDELGARYRQILLEYIRDHLPEHSDAGYSSAELAALNAHRQQREPFAPYAADHVAAAAP